MKKILTSLVVAGLMVMPAMSVLAVNTAVNPSTGELPKESGAVFAVINTVINWIFAIIIIFAVVMILIAAFTFLTSAGEPEKTTKARNYILYALVGIVVAFLAKAIVSLVAGMFGVNTAGLF